MSHYHSSLSELLVLLTPLIQMAKCLPTVQETQVWSLDRDDPLEKEVATHSSTLAWKIPWTEEPGRLQSMGSQRVGHNWATSHTHTHTHPSDQNHPMALILLGVKAKDPHQDWGCHMVRTPCDLGSQHHLPCLSPKCPHQTGLLAASQTHQAHSCLRSLPMLFPLPGMLFSKIPTRLSFTSDFHPISASKPGTQTLEQFCMLYPA